MQPTAPTLEKIAQRTGLSISTISRVLRGRADVSDQTRQMVEEQLQTLGYVAPAGSRRRGRPSKQQTPVIAIVCTRHDDVRRNPFSAPILAAALNGAAAMGARTLAIDWPEPSAIPADLQHASGILLIGSGHLAKESASRRPTVIVDTYVPGSGADGVVPDYRRGAFDAVRVLIQKGHRRIALLSGERSEHDDFSPQLYDGARRAMDLAGIELPPHFTDGCELTLDGGYALATRLLRLPEGERPTALFGGDHTMLGAIRAAHDLGLKVPEHVAIVGVDDIELGRFSIPRLSTVRVDKELLTQTALQRLLWRLQHRHAAPARIVMECQFIQRDSC